jgi:hypothetical protein
MGNRECLQSDGRRGTSNSAPPPVLRPAALPPQYLIVPRQLQTSGHTMGHGGAENPM